MAYGESVTMEAHMLQAAHLAEQDGEDNSVIASAFLHDIGHFLHAFGERVAEKGIDGKHELLAAKFLEKNFIEKVVDPIKYHIAAKRYLCYAETDYFDQLTPASVMTLQLQGGAFDKREAKEFERLEVFEIALKIRRLDERGKVFGMKTPDIEHFRPRLKKALKS